MEYEQENNLNLRRVEASGQVRRGVGFSRDKMWGCVRAKSLFGRETM